MAKPKSDPIDAIVEQRLGELTARFGDRWSEAELAEIRARIRRSAKSADALRAVKLTNADEPGNIFRPHRAGEAAR
jgi:hypothetical protein